MTVGYLKTNMENTSKANDVVRSCDHIQLLDWLIQYGAGCTGLYVGPRAGPWSPAEHSPGIYPPSTISWLIPHLRIHRLVPDEKSTMAVGGMGEGIGLSVPARICHNSVAETEGQFDLQE